MSEPTAPLAHLSVTDRAEDRDFHRRGGGDPRIRDVERRAHGGKLRGDLESSFDQAQTERAAVDDDELTLEELKALGVILVLQAADRAFPLKLDSLEQMSTHRKTSRRPKWLLLAVNPATDEQPESAVVWVSDEYRAAFLRLFEDFLERDNAAWHAGVTLVRAGHPDDALKLFQLGQIRLGGGAYVHTGHCARRRPPAAHPHRTAEPQLCPRLRRPEQARPDPASPHRGT